MERRMAAEEATSTTGHDILQAAAEAARNRLGGRLEAAYAIGSLAHGGFAPAVSDVDLALVVDRADADAGFAIERAHLDALARYAGTPQQVLAERLSIFWSDWAHLADGTEKGRFPATDRLDLLDSGVPLFGADRRAECRRPGRDDLLLDSATFAVRRFGDPDHLRTLRDPDGLAAHGARTVTKTVLFPVRLLYTATTGRLGRNDAAAEWYTATPQPGRILVDTALRWRTEGIDDPYAAAGLLRRGLLPLYAHAIERLGHHTAQAGHPELATRLARLRAALATMSPSPTPKR